MLSLRHINARYGRTPALFDVSLEVACGESVAVIGLNGAGKSTLLRSVLGFELTVEGDRLWQGVSIARWPVHRIARAGIGYVPEDRRLFARMSVRDNLALGQRAVRSDTAWPLEQVLALFPNLAGMLDRRADRLSGGEQQMLAIGRSLLAGPQLLLLDEPSEGLAPKLVAELSEALVAIRTSGVALLLAEQNIPLVQRLCRRALLLARGHIEAEVALDSAEAAICLRQHLTP